jgi:hypothetical protein
VQGTEAVFISFGAGANNPHRPSRGFLAVFPTLWAANNNITILMHLDVARLELLKRRPPPSEMEQEVDGAAIVRGKREELCARDDFCLLWE